MCVTTVHNPAEGASMMRLTCPRERCSDRSLESAEVIYATKDAAVKAQKQYNGVALDGKPMQIELVAADAPGGATLSSGLRCAHQSFHLVASTGQMPLRRIGALLLAALHLCADLRRERWAAGSAAPGQAVRSGS